MSNPRRARVAVATMFAVHGAITGTFATRVPWIAQHLHTDPGGLGFALLFGAIGAVSAMPFAGRITHRIRPRVAVPALMTLCCVMLVGTALAPSLPLLCVAMLLNGAAAGTADVAMNAQGVAVEQAVGRSIMSGLHGLWSFGGLAGSAIGVLAAYSGLDARIHFLLVAVALAVIALATGPALLDVRPPDEDAPLFALPPKAVVPIALVGFCAVFGELASSDWAAVYLTNVVHAAAAVAAAAFTGFALTMTLIRLIGDRIVNRFGPVLTVRCGGAMATLGALLVAFARTQPLAILGFALIGIGVAVVVPLAFAAAGNAGPRPGQQIAGIATIAYGAGLIAPAAIGGIAHASSLSTSFIVVATLTSLIVLGAGALRVNALAEVGADHS